MKFERPINVRADEEISAHMIVRADWLRHVLCRGFCHSPDAKELTCAF